MYAWEIEGTRLAEAWKQRNWKRMDTEDERWMNEHYKELNTVERPHPWCKGQVLSIDFGRLESTNRTTGVLRRLRILDASGVVVRSWDNEVGIAVKEANEAEKEDETRKCFPTEKLYLYWWSLQVQINYELHDVGALQEGDVAIDGLTRCVEAGMTLIGCSVERTAEVPDVGSCCRGATGDLRASIGCLGNRHHDRMNSKGTLGLYSAQTLSHTMTSTNSRKLFLSILIL